MKNNYSIFGLFKLYLGYIFTKQTILIFLFSIIIMIVSFILLSNPWLDIKIYEENKEQVVKYFLNDSCFLIQIFNSVIITTTVIMLVNKSQTFDILFVSYVPRTLLAVVKFFVIIIVGIILSLIEVLLVALIIRLRFYDYDLELSILNGAVYLFLSIIFEGSLSTLIATLFRNILAIMIVLFTSITFKVIINNYITHLVSYCDYLPILLINNNNLYFYMPSYLFTIIYVVLFLLLQVAIFNAVDLKNKE